jgi:hypothetical protein
LVDFDGVVAALPATIKEWKPEWNTYVELYRHEAVPKEVGRLHLRIPVGLPETFDRLPIQTLTLSTKFDTPSSLIKYAYDAKAADERKAARRATIGEAPQWGVVDAHHKGHEITNYKPALEITLPELDVTTEFKVLAVLKLIDRIAEQPISDRRTVLWFEDYLARDTALKSAVTDYAKRQQVHLEMPDIDTQIGVTPSHMKDVAKLCRQQGLRVERDWLVDAGMGRIGSSAASLAN